MVTWIDAECKITGMCLQCECESGTECECEVEVKDGAMIQLVSVK